MAEYRGTESNKEKLGEENEKTRRGRIKETHKTEIKKTIYRVKTEKKKQATNPEYQH